MSVSHHSNDRGSNSGCHTALNKKICPESWSGFFFYCVWVTFIQLGLFITLNSKLSALFGLFMLGQSFRVPFFSMLKLSVSVCVVVHVFLFCVKILGNFRVCLRLTPVSSCVSCVGLLVQDLTDTILSSYAYKSHYLLTESNRAELKLPMIPSPSSATKKNVGKGNWTVFLFLLYPTGLCMCCACSPFWFSFPPFFCTHFFYFQALKCKIN